MTFFNVYNSTIIISVSNYLSIVVTKVPIKCLASWIANGSLETFMAVIRLGKHLQAYYLTSSFGWSWMIVHNNWTVF